MQCTAWGKLLDQLIPLSYFVTNSKTLVHFTYLFLSNPWKQPRQTQASALIFYQTISCSCSMKSLIEIIGKRKKKWSRPLKIPSSLTHSLLLPLSQSMRLTICPAACSRSITEHVDCPAHTKHLSANHKQGWLYIQGKRGLPGELLTHNGPVVNKSGNLFFYPHIARINIYCDRKASSPTDFHRPCLCCFFSHLG